MNRYVLVAIVLFVITACQSSKTIVSSLDERDANEIMVLLSQNEIPASKIEEKVSGAGAQQASLWDIVVPAHDAVKAMEILSSNGLPRVKSPNLLQLFSEQGLVPSDMSEKVRYRVGLSDEISNMIRKIDGIVDATVTLSFPKEDELNPQAKLPPITASVYVKHTGVLDDPNRHLDEKIKLLVSGAVTGLSYDNVAVVPDRARFAVNPNTVIRGSPQAYVTVFGFMVATKSADAFQTFFICVAILLVVLLFVFLWLLWKLYPILKRRGGISQLFHISTL